MAIETKEQLLHQLRQERARWEALVAEVGQGRMETPSSLGDWSFKDTVAHLTTWWRWHVARVAAVRRGEPPVEHPSQRDVQVINRWIYIMNRDRPLADVLRDASAAWQEFEAGLAAIEEQDLMEPGRYPGLDGQALGRYEVHFFANHFHEEHEPAIREWLAGIGSSAR